MADVWHGGHHAAVVWHVGGHALAMLHGSGCTKVVVVQLRGAQRRGMCSGKGGSNVAHPAMRHTAMWCTRPRGRG